jgi:T4 RnlA family RNA ligase
VVDSDGCTLSITLRVNEMALYDDLMNLCETNEAFYFKDFQLDNATYMYRIFNYRIASYSDFLLPGALEARGIMYRVGQGDPLLVCRPMHKFFNLFENPMTTDLDLSGDITVMDKHDGSLISTFMDNGIVRFKSKGSLFSEQAKDAFDWFHSEADPRFRYIVENMTMNWFTVNMEWQSPTNRIVVPYQKPELVILNYRRVVNGEYIFNEMGDCAVNRQSQDKTFVDSIRGMNSSKDEPVIEGFVCITEDGTWFKVKTERYCALHLAKDDITNPKRLFDAILNESTDDLKSMFHDDEYLIDQIDDMEKKVIPKMNHIRALVDDFFEVNNGLDRKSFAIKAKEETGIAFPLLMGRYTGKELDIKAFFSKNIEYLIND